MADAPKSTQKAVIEQWRFEYDAFSNEGTVQVPGTSMSVLVGKGFAPRGGYFMKNIYHADYRMAYDLGVIGIWAMPGKKARDMGFKAKLLVLGAPDFTQRNENWGLLDPGQTYSPVKSAGGSYLGLMTTMDVYNSSVKGELVGRFMTREPLFGKGSGHLLVEQKFVFTDYDSQPAHEPAGAILAARLHPMISLSYFQADEDWVESFRVDYRLYLNLDSYEYSRFSRMPSQWMDPGEIIKGREQKVKDKLDSACGVFKDDDTSFPIYNGLNVDDVVFEAAEKPLKFELMTHGINHNLGRLVWDNIHWWAAANSKGSILPSTPGAFHAVHVHWRWSEALQEGSWYTPEHSGKRQFNGLGVGGIMVDPRIDHQLLRLAVLVNQGLPSDIHSHTTEDPTKFAFDKRGKEPAEIKLGADLVMYYSVEISLNDRSSVALNNSRKDFLGTVFVHGLFFAHESEVSSMYTGAFGKAAYIRPKNVPKQWIRHPDI